MPSSEVALAILSPCACHHLQSIAEHNSVGIALPCTCLCQNTMRLLRLHLSNSLQTSTIHAFTPPQFRTLLVGQGKNPRRSLSMNETPLQTLKTRPRSSSATSAVWFARTLALQSRRVRCPKPQLRRGLSKLKRCLCGMERRKHRTERRKHRTKRLFAPSILLLVTL